VTVTDQTTPDAIETPADQTPADQTPADQTPADQTPADETPETVPETEPEADRQAVAADDSRDDETANEPADDAADEADQDAAPTSDIERLENEGDIAADYLEELLDIADLDGDLDMDVEGDRAAVSIVGADLSQLVGRNGEVLEALQELTRLAVYRETGERSRLMLDIGGHRATRRSRLEKVAAEVIAEVRASGERQALDPMSPFERKVVHDAVAAAGLRSESEGEEPRRRVVVLPA
jgi:spoIIIJ-associated protein